MPGLMIDAVIAHACTRQMQKTGKVLGDERGLRFFWRPFREPVRPVARAPQAHHNRAYFRIDLDAVDVLERGSSPTHPAPRKKLPLTAIPNH
jgi:hypothetical protein